MSAPRCRAGHRPRLLLAVGGLSACGGGSADSGASCPTWSSPAAAGQLSADSGITEASGLAASPAHAGVLWTHDDGDSGVIQALTDGGAALGRVQVPAGSAEDWEDMAAVDDGSPWLVMADIGDNDATRDEVAVLWVPEPDDPEADSAPAAVSRSAVTLPDGPVDAEALFIDPDSGLPHLVTREDGRATILALPGRGESGAAAVVADLALPDGVGAVRAADVSPDGARLLLRTTDAVLTWALGADLATTLAGPPCLDAGPDEPDGEALAALDGAYLTVSEGVAPTLWRVSEGS